MIQSTSVVDVFIDTKPRGAEVFVDGVLALDDMCRVIKTPIIITNIPIGLRKFTFRLSGYYNETVVIDVSKGIVNSVFSVLFPKLLV